MNPSHHLTAKAVNGAVTLTSNSPFLRMVVLGSSCWASVNRNTGPADSVVIVPKEEKEVIAIGIYYESCNKMWDVFLLQASRSQDEKGNARVDLDRPLVSSAEAIGQMFKTVTSFWMEVTCGDNTYRSVTWHGVPPQDGATVPDSGDNDPDTLCHMLAGRRPWEQTAVAGLIQW